MTEKHNDALPLMLTRREFSTIVGMSERFVDRRIKTGQIRVRRFGRSIRIPQSELERFVKA